MRPVQLIGNHLHIPLCTTRGAAALTSEYPSLSQVTAGWTGSLPGLLTLLGSGR